MTFKSGLSKTFFVFATICGALCVAAFILPFSPSLQNGLALGAALALLNALVSFFALRWAFGRSDKAFFGALFGGMLWKLAVLGATFAFLTGQTAVHPAAALIMLAVLTLLFSALETGFLSFSKESARHGL